MSLELETKCFIIQCKKHWPGYELYYNSSIKECLKEMKSWINCDLDFLTLQEISLSERTEYQKLAHKYLESWKLINSPEK